MNEYQSLNHTKWDCTYHVVWIPKYRKKTLYGQLRKDLRPILIELARQKESEIVEGRLVADHGERMFEYCLIEVFRRLTRLLGQPLLGDVEHHDK
ncbi:MAG: Transposase IS200 like protein [Syntrophorhabdaceae bacterium PtaU1.Bin034]|nr:MAG: Transposase IS200 like protein [Syntrophorhabdaceae bacterium PtaU1.Bin034]